MKKYTTIIALALALPTAFTNAQPPEGRPPGPPPGEGRPPQGERPTARKEIPRVPPVVAALDKNRDGIISEDEIAAAADSLRTLAKGPDGKLTVQDLLGPPPQGGPRDGEARREVRGQRDGDRPRNAERPRDGERPKDGDRPRDGERGAKPRGDGPRDGVRPEGGPKPERPPGDAPRPDGERRPNPEG